MLFLYARTSKSCVTSIGSCDVFYSCQPDLLFQVVHADSDPARPPRPSDGDTTKRSEIYTGPPNVETGNKVGGERDFDQAVVSGFPDGMK